MAAFDAEVRDRIAANARNRAIRDAVGPFMHESILAKYSYNFSWLGRPIIQYPQDIVAMQELIWSVKPEVIVETGIAHGGSLILWASLLELNALSGGPRDSLAIGVDIDIRAHNKAAIEAHPLARRVMMIEGSSTDPDIITQVYRHVAGRRALVALDSNHTHAHVLAELEAYAPLTSVGSYCVVFDTIVDAMPQDTFPDRPWGPGDNPNTAVQTFLRTHPEFQPDREMDAKLLISAAPGGYLKRMAQ